MDSAREIEHLRYDYADRIDAGNFAGVGPMFAHGSFFRLEGAAAVQAIYEQTTRLHDDGTPRTQHLITNVVVEVDEEAGTATGRARFQVLQQTETLPLQTVVAGRYRDTFHRLDGRWWFATREAEIVLTGTISEHLLPGTIS